MSSAPSAMTPTGRVRDADLTRVKVADGPRPFGAVGTPSERSMPAIPWKLECRRRAIGSDSRWASTRSKGQAICRHGRRRSACPGATGASSMIRTSRLGPSGGCKSGDVPQPGGERLRHPAGHAPAPPSPSPSPTYPGCRRGAFAGPTGGTPSTSTVPGGLGVSAGSTPVITSTPAATENPFAARAPDDRAISQHAEGRHMVETFGKRPSSLASQNDLAGFRPPFHSTGSAKATSTFAGSPPSAAAGRQVQAGLVPAAEDLHR